MYKNESLENKLLIAITIRDRAVAEGKDATKLNDWINKTELALNLEQNGITKANIARYRKVYNK